MALDDDFAGGYSNYYNPSFGLMAIQQPEMFVQHLASKGIQPPADFPSDFTFQDAHTKLAGGPAMPEQLTSPDQKRAWRNLSPAQQKNVADFWNSGDPAALDRAQPQAQAPQPQPPPQNPTPQTPGSTRYNFQPLGGPASSVSFPNRDSGSLGRNLMSYLNTDAIDNPTSTYFDPITQQEITAPKAATPEDAARQAQPPINAPKPAPEWTTTPTEPWGGRANVNPTPTPSPDSPSTAGGSSVAAGGTEEKPGTLNTAEPATPALGEAADKKKKTDSQDSFGKALAGLSAIKPTPPVLPHPGPLPHQANQIARSTLPTELLKELSQIGKPGAHLRLGQALKGV